MWANNLYFLREQVNYLINFPYDLILVMRGCDFSQRELIQGVHVSMCMDPEPSSPEAPVCVIPSLNRTAHPISIRVAIAR